ncbi:chromogranin-A [Hyla sarda]|uniref:chromogranin-A n=1 Tax=Hyla sarda TaxID=327740 RepID=UPI0024C3FCA7|nr:chromogranin-A [Hyla sarda]
MLYIGVLSVALCAVQVISFPATSRDTEDNTKVMKCIVEVISDTLSKPKPVPTSEDCLETLRGDERIISILRHQNLLKELQELAAQGAMERIQKQKKNGAGFAEELSGILEKQNNKPLPSDKSQASPLLGKSPERDEEEEEEEERKRSSEREDSNEELESNEISKREETSEEEEIDNRITDEINDMELPKDNREDEEEPGSKKEAEEDPDKENRKQDRNETDNEEDDTQREDNSMRIPEDFTKDSNSESDNSKEAKQDADTIDCGEENAQGDGDASKDLEDSKRWNKMDELAKELRAKKCAARSSEDTPDRSMKIPPKEPSDLSSQEDRQQPQPSREDSAETEAPILKRAEEKKEEEGSANRKTEDQELESLAAIEAELENVAHKLHDLRRG